MAKKNRKRISDTLAHAYEPLSNNYKEIFQLTPIAGMLVFLGISKSKAQKVTGHSSATCGIKSFAQKYAITI